MPTIKKPNQHFDVVTWTGVSNTASRTITGIGFQPDFLWTKVRTNDYNHLIYDSVRGAGSDKELYSNLTDNEGNSNPDTFDYLSSFNSDGFSSTWSGSNRAAYFNQINQNYVAWLFKAGGASTVNTSGTISSNVSVNTTAGFSIVTYTNSAGRNAHTVGHGLGVAPKMFIVKTRSATADWPVYHSSIGATGAVYLNLTLGTQTSAAFFNDAAPTSSIITLGSGVSDAGVTIVAYCWAEVEGFSKFGSYAGNSSTDGPFIYTGFKPRWILVKKYAGGTASNWHLHDTARDTYNSSNSILIPDSGGAESVSSGFAFDILSNGFKLRTSDGSTNGSTLSYIYAAFAESPFKYSNAR